MFIYHFDEYGYFLKKTKARVDPLDTNKYLIPRNATDTPPPLEYDGDYVRFDGETWRVGKIPTPGPHEIAVREDGEWLLVPDYRGTPFYLLPDRTPLYVYNIGEDLPEGAVLKLPPLTPEERERLEFKEKKELVDAEVDNKIASFELGGDTYFITDRIVDQFIQTKILLEISDNPLGLFPIYLVIGEKIDEEKVKKIRNVQEFKTLLTKLLVHLKNARDYGLKQKHNVS